MIDLIHPGIKPKDLRNTSIHIKSYQHFLPLFKKALGPFFTSDYYVAMPKRLNPMSSKAIHFGRFAFDVISLAGENLLNLTDDEFEVLIRKFFQTITFLHNGKLMLINSKDVVTPWDKQEVSHCWIS